MVERKMERKPRLTFYSYDSQGNPWLSGGGSLRDWEVLSRLTPHAEVTLVVGRYLGFKPGTRDGVRTIGVGFGNSDGLCRVMYTLAANLRMLFDGSDVIGMSPSMYAPVLLWWFHRRRSYLVLHHYIGRQSFRKFGVFGIFPFLCEQFMMRRGRNYFTLNRAVRERLRIVNPNARVELTANGFDPALLNLNARHTNPRLPGSSNPDSQEPAPTPPFILFVGRFDVYMKGLDLLIPVYLKAAVSHGVDLVLAGRASEKDAQEVANLVPESMRSRVRMEVNISTFRKEELLSSCLFFCSPSRFEGFGIAALEANAAGKAVLATDTEGFRDSLVWEQTALGVPVEDRQALETAMVRLLEDPELRERLGRQGREHARAFSWDSIAEKDWQWIRPIVERT
jgi:glycosyltransferase involved in cell wall biosynthesis